MSTQYDEYMVVCENCGNEWDGNAQCVCGMLDVSNEDEPNETSDDENASTSSDASDMLSDFEDSGHISMDTVRESIQQMLVIARSQEDSDDEPEWMDETRDYLTHGQFIDGKYCISAYVVSSELATPPFKQMVMGIYPMLTAEECDQFLEQSKAGMLVVDIVDGFNIKRMRDYETARVYSLHWPQWAEGEHPMLELVKMIGE